MQVSNADDVMQKGEEYNRSRQWSSQRCTQRRRPSFNRPSAVQPPASMLQLPSATKGSWFGKNKEIYKTFSGKRASAVFQVLND